MENAPDWLLQRLSGEPQDVKVQIAMVLWGIWSIRNLKVWDSKAIRAHLAMEWSRKDIVEWQEARKIKLGRNNSKMQGGNQSIGRWVAPQVGKLKLNVDASVFPGTSFFSVGMILRDHQGLFIKVRSARCAGEVSVFEAKAWGVLKALKWLLTFFKLLNGC